MLRICSIGRAASAFVIAALAVGCSQASNEEETSSTSEAALCSVECPNGTMRGDALLTPVNRTNRLRSDWTPPTTVLPAAYRQSAQQSMRPDAAAQFMAMADAARASGVNIVCLSGYRSFATQCSLFASYAGSNGCEQANTFSAHAGHSEHQLGTVCDVALTSSATSFIVPGGPADTWLSAHAYEYGFANSYPNDDPQLNDGYVHEPWHYRFIGVVAATALQEKQATLAAGRRLSVPVFIAGLSREEAAALEGGEAPPPPPERNACDGANGVTGWFCGGSLGIPSDDAGYSSLYRCATDPATGRMTVASATQCPNGCAIMPTGVPDACR